MSCHPSHTPEEEKEKLRIQQKKDLSVDPRKIRRQHIWKLGHDPSTQDEDHDPNVAYLDIEVVEGGPTEPDQRGELIGGPPSGMPCQRCGEMTVVAGRKSLKDIYDQPEVDLVNRDQMTKEDWKRIEETVILVLACPNCKAKYQWREEFLPKKLHPIE